MTTIKVFTAEELTKADNWIGFNLQSYLHTKLGTTAYDDSDFDKPEYQIDTINKIENASEIQAVALKAEIESSMKAQLKRITESEGNLIAYKKKLLDYQKGLKATKKLTTVKDIIETLSKL